MNNYKKQVTSSMSPANSKFPSEIEEGYFKPLEVNVEYSFDRAVKTFRSMVQAEQIVANWKQRQAFESPGQKRRRKQKQSIQRLWEEEIKMKKILDGTYDKEKAYKEQKKQKKMEERAEKMAKEQTSKEE